MKLIENIKEAHLAATKRGQLANTRGMTLIEIMIVITIMASIMGVVGFYVVGALEEANIKEAKIQMGNLNQSLDMYYTRTDPHEYPESLQKLVDRNIMQEVPSDPWGEQYVYRRDSRNEFTLMSKGPDMTEGTEDDITPGGDGGES
ncbi:prepilin-type N-terminal cleavage/methylation domain-containing protein [Persicimonas caeni]|uniref:Prepilin-type N-terminal cleavage/methylation domain-containing protein n=1 Tax=Persicimonas caeni TaxID=2292766 RepID=A0A4Y6PP63_PERCE|nr:type II secretion system protein GspG [Persicimonas caeni]QDG50112.1 prepilin-type N-terminal cleavage/methylation domain-containing protein [Persicimonas caeni]QED31333.1 prepilin-type N-terminal cleavage/methylation domain-containing protein [Persicimonas caeni]